MDDSFIAPAGLEPLIGKSLEDLQEIVTNLGMPKFSAKQICQWIYSKRVSSIEEMTDLSKANRAKLAQRYFVGLYAPASSAKSSDGTIKYLFDTVGGGMVESVYIPDADRATLCISTQKGCKMGCAFCMTGKQGFHGNLSSREILNQIFSIPESQSLTNVVFMGMGEPLDNTDEVLKTISVLTAKWGLEWSPKRITVSSIGKMPGLKQLLDKTHAHVAISVHSPFHEERLALMPAEKAFPVKKTMELLREYDFKHQRRLSAEYIMWDGVNDDDKHAEALAKLLAHTGARVNLIRFHSIPGAKLRTSTDERMVKFRDLLNRLGITCTIRKSRGEDIAAACGMLAGKNKQ